ncbi:MAG: pyridoxamine 5'-phosphate oxidase family protein [Dehalococcoidia bacterium]
MANLSDVGPRFIEMAHRIVWATVATTDAQGRPRSRILHPLWVWEGDDLVGWIATSPTPTKRAHIEAHPYVSVNYWTPEHDTCVAECRASWGFDDETRTRVWNLFKDAPPPVGYDPAMVPTWPGPTDDNFAVLRLEPWHLRVFPGTVLLGQGGDVLTWRAPA